MGGVLDDHLFEDAGLIKPPDGGNNLTLCMLTFLAHGSKKEAHFA